MKLRDFLCEGINLTGRESVVFDGFVQGIMSLHAPGERADISKKLKEYKEFPDWDVLVNKGVLSKEKVGSTWYYGLTWDGIKLAREYIRTRKIDNPNNIKF